MLTFRKLRDRYYDYQQAKEAERIYKKWAPFIANPPWAFHFDLPEIYDEAIQGHA